MCFFFQAEDGIRDIGVTGVQTCALPISSGAYSDGAGVPGGRVSHDDAGRYRVHSSLRAEPTPRGGRDLTDAGGPAHGDPPPGRQPYAHGVWQPGAGLPDDDQAVDPLPRIAGLPPADPAV